MPHIRLHLRDGRRARNAIGERHERAVAEPRPERRGIPDDVARRAAAGVLEHRLHAERRGRRPRRSGGS